MATAHVEAKRDKTLNLRIRDDERALIERAAKVCGKTRTEFIMGAVRREAADALLDQAYVSVSPEVYDAFLARLDEAPNPNDRLRKTMSTPAPWEV
ncbi:type II toxin-antitoxin system TacA family antitoxin [Oceanimonas smirnovii]|uniref:type II toxin-antitoxin system TacA family antitoxin n=1 Tax=Oceanimonas smirnovii TaxID=264574 RepID=UPI00376FB47D